MELKAFLIYEDLIMVAHYILFRLMNVHRLKVHIWDIFLAHTLMLEIILVITSIGALKLLVESFFEVLAIR